MLYEFPDMFVPGSLGDTTAVQARGAERPPETGAALCQVLRACLFVGHHCLYFYVINILLEGTNRMLMTVAEMTKSGGVTSFDKWPGYEQQCVTKTKTSQKYG